MSHKSDVYFPTDLDLFDVFVKTDSFILSKLEGNHFYEIKGVKDNLRLYTLVDSVYAQYKIDFYIDEKKTNPDLFNAQFKEKYAVNTLVYTIDLKIKEHQAMQNEFHVSEDDETYKSFSTVAKEKLEELALPVNKIVHKFSVEQK